MAKDPAINWYFDNWDGGTKLFTRHQKGCYMDLLSAQFHCGHLTIENIKTILGPDFSEWNKILSGKFEADENGLFFNERIEHEIKKREKFIEKQIQNGKKGGRPKTQKEPKENPSLNPNHNPNKSLYGTEIENGIGIVSFGKSENLFLKIHEFAKEISNSYSQIEAAARKNKTSPDEIKKLIPDFIDVCITKSKNEDTWHSYCNYFSNWLASEFSKKQKSTNKNPHQLREMNYNEKP